MGPRQHSLAIAHAAALGGPVSGDGGPPERDGGTARDGAGSEPPARPSAAARRASAPVAHRTRGYFRTLSATSVGLEMAVSVVLPLLVGIWLDRKAGTSPWLMLLFLCFGFAAGVRAVWRYVAAADQDARESEEERDARGGP
jgi:ATP synthase protein I